MKFRYIVHPSLIRCEKIAERLQDDPDVFLLPDMKRVYDYKALFEELEYSASSTPFQPILFVTIGIARLVKRFDWQYLVSGLFYEPASLSVSSTLVSVRLERILNDTGVFLPVGRVAECSSMIERMFGNRIFIRPDSAEKPFTGFVMDMENVDFEMTTIIDALHVNRAEMCFIGPAKDIGNVEYRVWIIGGNVSAVAAYTWEDDGMVSVEPSTDALEAATEAARRVAFDMALVTDTFVADFVKHDGMMKLIEMNSVSTSGFYSGADFHGIVNHIEKEHFSCIPMTP